MMYAIVTLAYSIIDGADHVLQKRSTVEFRLLFCGQRLDVWYVARPSGNKHLAGTWPTVVNMLDIIRFVITPNGHVPRFPSVVTRIIAWRLGREGYHNLVVIIIGFRDSVAKVSDKRQRVPTCCEVSPNVVVRVYGSCRNAIVSAEKVRPIGDPLDVEEATFNRTVVPYVCPKGGGKANSRCLKRYDVQGLKIDSTD